MIIESPTILLSSLLKKRGPTGCRLLLDFHRTLCNSLLQQHIQSIFFQHPLLAKTMTKGRAMQPYIGFTVQSNLVQMLTEGILLKTTGEAHQRSVQHQGLSHDKLNAIIHHALTAIDADALDKNGTSNSSSSSSSSRPDAEYQLQYNHCLSLLSSV